MNNYTTARAPLRKDEVSWILQEKIEAKSATQKVEVQASTKPVTVKKTRKKKSST